MMSRLQTTPPKSSKVGSDSFLRKSFCAMECEIPPPD
jgi:hypothetical protein